MAGRISNRIVTDGLVLYLDASNPKSYVSGSTTWYDLSGNNYHGTLINGAGFSSERNGCMTFDGIDDMVTTNFNTLNNSCSFEIWVNRIQSNNVYNIMIGMFRPYFAFRSGNYLQFTNTISGVTQSVISSGGLTNNTWYCFHFTNSYDGINTTVNIYINGVLVGNGSFAGQITTTTQNPLIIGHYRITPIDYPFQGKISIVKVYNKTLTSTEVLQNYNAMQKRYLL